MLMTKKLAIKFTIFHIISFLSVFLVIVLWFILSSFNLVNPLFLSSPFKVYTRFMEYKKIIIESIGITFYRLLLGFVLGCILGVLVAFLMSINVVIRGLLDKLIPFFKSIPPLSIVPFMVLWFGLKPLGVWVLVTWGCFFILVMITYEAIKNVPKIYQWSAAVLDTSKLGMFTKIIFPAIMPEIMAGIRVAGYISLSLCILAEFNLGYGGLGMIIINGYRFIHVDLLFLGIILAIIIAIINDLIMIGISCYVNRWV